MFSIFRQPLTVTRKSGGEFVNGIWTPGTTAEVPIEASVQPASPDDMQRLPEGRRQDKAYVLRSDQELLEVDDNAEQSADLVTIGGETYEVMRCSRWQNSIINHFESLVVRQSEQSN